MGGSAKTQSWLRLRFMGIAFGGVLPLLGFFFCAIPTSHGIPSVRAQYARIHHCSYIYICIWSGLYWGNIGPIGVICGLYIGVIYRYSGKENGNYKIMIDP